MPTYIKDPDAVLDYKFDWKPLTNLSGNSDWLGSSEIISSYTITAAPGLTIDSDSQTDTNTSVTVWLSGGTDGTTYELACKIVTSSSPSRTDERTIRIQVEER